MEGGPSDRIRTCGILLPKQARYQLRYTRLLSYSIRLVVFSQTYREYFFRSFIAVFRRFQFVLLTL